MALRSKVQSTNGKDEKKEKKGEEEEENIYINVKGKDRDILILHEK